MMMANKKTEVLELHVEVTELIRQGYTPYAIAKKLGVRPHKIYYSIKKYGKG